MASAADSFPTIGGYGFLSDCHTSALVSFDGAIEWLCLPRFDSPSVFAALLDRGAGRLTLRPPGVVVPISRRYRPGTLVVETTNLPKAQAFMGAWEQLKVTERFTRVGKDRLLYQFQVEDPTVWAAPFGGEYEFSTASGRVYEYACHEGNYGLMNILAGARAEEGTLAQREAGKR